MTSYKGYTIEIKQEESEKSNGFEYEIWLYIHGEKVISATELERKYDYSRENASWPTHLRKYAKAFIDGMEYENKRFTVDENDPW